VAAVAAVWVSQREQLVLVEVLLKIQAKMVHYRLLILLTAQIGLLLVEMVDQTQVAAVAVVEGISHLADLVGQA
jgi:hypothetical protein